MFLSMFGHVFMYRNTHITFPKHPNNIQDDICCVVLSVWVYISPIIVPSRQPLPAGRADVLSTLVI